MLPSAPSCPSLYVSASSSTKPCEFFVIVLFDVLTTPVDVPLTVIDAVAPEAGVLTVANAETLAAPFIADFDAV